MTVAQTWFVIIGTMVLTVLLLGSCNLHTYLNRSGGGVNFNYADAAGPQGRNNRDRGQQQHVDSHPGQCPPGQRSVQRKNNCVQMNGFTRCYRTCE